MKVGFYHPKERIMYAVEQWNATASHVPDAAQRLGRIYRSGKHWMPSPFWCIWGNEYGVKIFSLSGESLPASEFDHIFTLLV